MLEWFELLDDPDRRKEVRLGRAGENSARVGRLSRALFRPDSYVAAFKEL